MMKAFREFIEMPGGVIIGPNGRDAVRVAVDELTTADASRITRAVIAALNAEFAVEPDTPIADRVDAAVKAAIPSILKGVKDTERRGL
ncbi:hypothetical protein ACFOHK_08275 [Falsigemmobacter intermedius]|uniref:Uncharacterized protein n=1 Tax=Falsigemmobacter intermedius TaxID=1553448 RepID=A0A444M8D7_9RHOB|nr:hypothetical protein [Falsigemmobacter intermedius]RWY37125.1 hypothetical protein EP867_17560 [Falsigemmobacter intermedius]